MTKNVDSDKCSYFGQGIWFNTSSSSSLPSYHVFGKTVMLFGVNNTSSFHSEKRDKDILILVEGPTDALDDTKLTEKAGYSIIFRKQQKKFYITTKVTVFCSSME